MSFNEWKKYKLEELIDIKHGYAFKGKFFSDEETNLILLTPGNFKIGGGFQDKKFKFYSKEGEIPEQYILNKDDILVTMTDLSKDGDTLGYPLKVPMIKDKTLLHNQRLGKVIIKNTDISKDYLYWLMCTREYRYEVLSSATGTTVKHTAPDRILKFKFSLPPIEEQKAIAKILSDLDDKIEVNNKINKNLEDMAQAIFKSWFVDFEFPNEEGKPYKSSGGEMGDSELGMIPKGWEVKELGEISDIQNGFAFKAPEYVNDGIKVMRTLNINNNGYFENDNIVFLPETYRDDKYRKYILNKFDVNLVMVGASIGKIGMILENTSGSLQNQNMWRFRTCDENIPQLFLNYLIREAQSIAQNWSTGSAREFYRKDSFSKIKVIYPDGIILEKFDKNVMPMFELISNLVLENEKLSNLRDILLPKLMSGEIRVPID